MIKKIKNQINSKEINQIKEEILPHFVISFD